MAAVRRSIGWTRVDRVRRGCLAALVFVLSLTSAPSPTAQSGSPPKFEPVGLQPDRAMFSQLPFEAIDMVNGNVMLTFTDLALPGDAGMDLRLTRTYTRQAALRPWQFGIAGVPMRIGHPEGNGNDLTEVPILFMADGTIKRAYPVNTLVNDTVFQTPDFWRYTSTTRTLEMPNGWVATYESVDFAPGGAMLLEVHDVYGNSLTPEWEDADDEDIRPLRLRGVTQTVSSTTRVVTFEYESPECGVTFPSKMTYAGRDWEYDCEFEDVTLQTGPRLTGVTPPVGPTWTFAYEGGFGGSLTVTMPTGGVITYDFDERTLPSYEETPKSVIASRTIGGRDVTGGTWSFDFSQPPGGQASGIVTTPDGRKMVFEHEWSPLGARWLLIRKTLRSAQNAVVSVLDRSYVDLPYIANFPGNVTPVVRENKITQDSRVFKTTFDYRAQSFGDYHQPERITEDGDLTRVTTRTYDEAFGPYLLNRLKSETVTFDNQSFTKSYEYEDATGFLESETTYGVQRRYERDARGNRRSTKDGLNKEITNSYENGTLKDVGTPGYSITRGINPDGTVGWERHGEGQQHLTTFEYDDLGRQKKMSPPGVDETTTTYDNNGGAWIEVARGARVVRTDLDGLGRPVRTLDSAGVRTRTQYDSDGRVSYEGLPYKNDDAATDQGDTLEYDDLGRLLKRIRPGGAAVEYTRTGAELKIRDEAGHETRQKWAAFGNPSEARLVEVIDAANEVWRYTYNAVGSLTSVTSPTDGSQPGRVWVYSDKNQLQRETHPESGTTVYNRYDPAGNLEEKHDAKNRRFEYFYDANNRLRKIDSSFDDYDTVVTYKGENRETVTNAYVESRFAYDATNRLRSRADIINGHTYTVSYEYDGVDNLTKVIYPNGRQVVYDIDQSNGMYVTKVHEPGRTLFAENVKFEPSGALRSYTAGNGQTEHITYDSRRRPDVLQSGPLHLNYDHDDVGNVTKITDGRPEFTQEFGYDSLDRLTSVTGSFGATSFTYYANGNRRTKGDVTYHYWPDQRLKETTGGFDPTTYAHDAVGNLEATNRGTAFTYTPFNQVQTFTATNLVTQTSSVTTYRYDGDDRRAIKIPPMGPAQIYVHGTSGQLLAEYEQSDAAAPEWMRDYVFLGSRILASVSAPRPIVGFEVAASSVPEPGQTATVRVKLTTPDSRPLAQPVTVQFAAVSGTAGANVDFALAPGTLTFAAASADGAVQTISVDILDDTALEEHETFTIVLSAATRADLGVRQHTVTILDDEPKLAAYIDRPLANEKVYTRFTVEGWAIDERATLNAGIDVVKVYARAAMGGTLTLLGTASYGTPRPDVAAAYGPQFLNSAVGIAVTQLAYGDYDIYLSAHMVRDGSEQQSVPVRVTVEPSEKMAVDTPQHNGKVPQLFHVQGWAIDREAPSGTGVDLVQVTAYPLSGPGAAINLGPVAYGVVERPDVAAFYRDTRFLASGFTVSTAALAPGPYRLQVQARSTVDQTMNTSYVDVVVESDQRTVITAPVDESHSGQRFTVAGCAIDAAAAWGTGVDQVQVVAYRNGAGPEVARWTASYGAPCSYGSPYTGRFAPSGFSLDVTSLTAGQYRLDVEARSTFSPLIRKDSVRVTVDTDTRINIDLPVQGLPGQGTTVWSSEFRVAGWAADLKTATGTGVSTVHVLATRVNTTNATHLGAATYGLPRPDVAQAFGPAFEPSGFNLYVRNLAVGDYHISAVAFSTVTGTFNATHVVTVHVEDSLVTEIDSPAAGAGLPQAFTIAGRAFDRAASSGSGIDRVVVRAVSLDTGVTTTFGDAVLNGNNYQIASVPLIAGSYRLEVQAHSSVSGLWGAVISRTVAIQSNPRISIATPIHNTVTGLGVTVSGAAADLSAATGTGVSAVQIYAQRQDGSPQIHLGAATYGLDRPDMASQHGTRFGPSGFSRQVALPGLGVWLIHAYGLSTVTGGHTMVATHWVNAQADPRMSIDLPLHNSTTGQPIVIGGWAVDRGAASGSGVDAVDVYVTGNGVSRFVGRSPANGARPDLAAVYGQQFLYSGYTLSVTGLSPGTYTVTAHSHSAVTDTWQSQQVTITLPPPNAIVTIDLPASGAAVGQPFGVTGWAIDTNHPTHAGVAFVHIWAYPASGAPPVFLGQANVTGNRPDIGAAYGSRFTPSGWGLTTSATLTPGWYTLVVTPYSTVKDGFHFEAAVVRAIYVQ